MNHLEPDKKEQAIFSSSIRKEGGDKRLPEGEDLIWQRFKAGNQSALTYIYRNYTDLLFNYGCQFTSDRSLVKDCLQDLFLELINRRERLGDTSSIKYYLMRAFRNKIVKVCRKNKKRAEDESSSQYESFSVVISPELKMINGQLDEEKQQLLQEKLNLLAPLQREALLLYFYEGLKYQQIADMLGIKRKSSRALVYRGIQSLAALLGPHKDEIMSVLLATALLKNF